MPDWIFKNKPTAYATLASPSGTSGTTLTLTTGHGTRLPAPSAGQISAVRIENELITYTGNSGDVLTGVTRGAGATNHVAGTEVKNVLVEEWANAVTALSTDTKAALAGTSGTPQAANPYVTDADARNSNARPPTSHGHVESDTTGLVADLAARVLSTDSRLSDARTPTTHAISHKATGGDVLAGVVGGYAPLDSGLLVPVANLATGTPTGSKFLRDDRVWAVPAGGGGGSLTIEELDGTPSIAAATKLILPNGTVSVTGTEATYTPSGGGGGTDVASILTTPGDLLIESGSSYTRLSTPTASASSTNSGFVASNAFDGNTSTFWASNVSASTPGEWLKGDFGSGVTPTAVRLLQSAAGQRVGQWKLQSSPDNSTWTDQYTSATGQESVADSGILALSGMPSVRYWRLISVSSTDSSIWLVYEFYLYSGGGPTPVRLAAGQVLTDAATITWDVTTGHNAQVTLGGNRTLAAPTNLIAGQVYTLRVVQDGTGSRTLTWNAAYKFGATPTLPTAANAVAAFEFVTDGTNMYCIGATVETLPTSGGGGGLYSAYLLFIDQKAAGTNGGTFTAGAWRTRNMTVKVVDTGGNGSLASDQMTIAPGTYDVEGSAPAFNLSYHAARLYDITNSAVLLDGTSEFTQGGASVSTRSWVIGRIVLSGSTVIELQHYSAGTQGTNGFGVSANSGGIPVAHEVYSRLAFYKV